MTNKNKTNPAKTKAKSAKTKAKPDAKKDDTDDEPAVVEEAKEIEPLQGGSISLVLHSHQCHAVTISGATDPDDVLHTDFWKNNARTLNAGDEIRVLTDDYSVIQNLLAVYKEGSSVGVVRLSMVKLSDPITQKPDERFMVAAGPRGGYIVRDMANGEQIGGVSPTRSKAERVAEDHAKALGL